MRGTFVASVSDPGADHFPGRTEANRIQAIADVILFQRDAEVSQVGLRGRNLRLRTRSHEVGNEYGGQDGDDSDNNEQFNERESAPLPDSQEGRSKYTPVRMCARHPSR